MDIGKKIKVLRAKNGISQQKLAELINKTRALISHIEVTSKVNYFTLKEISKVLNVSVDYFTDNSDKEIVSEKKIVYSSLTERINKLERENELLKEIISNQKEVIAQLKNQLKK